LRALSQNPSLERSIGVDVPSDALVVTAAHSDQVDLEAVFIAHYARIARVLARLVRDRARAEELAVDAFLKWSSRGGAKGDHAAGWLYRTAIRLGLDELRRRSRRDRAEQLVTWWRRRPPTPEDVRATSEAQRRVRAVLTSLRARDAEMLVLRSEDLRYDEIAALLDLNPSSVGTLLSRAQQAFRQEYVRRYGDQ
jgi:RNA polymerase sigma-70 factor (ECF subfamily)